MKTAVQLLLPEMDGIPTVNVAVAITVPRLPRFPLAKHQSQSADDSSDNSDPGPDHPFDEAELQSVQRRIQRFVGHVVAVVGSAGDGTRDDFSLVAIDAPSRQLSGHLERVEHAWQRTTSTVQPATRTQVSPVHSSIRNTSGRSMVRVLM